MNTRIILVMTILFINTNCKVRILHFQSSGFPSASSYAKFLGQIPQMEHFAFCYRLQLYFYRTESVTISYATHDQDNAIRVDHILEGFRVFLNQTILNFPHSAQLREWNHFCFSLDFSSRNLTVFINGYRTFERTLSPNDLVGNIIPGGGTLILGQEQDFKEGGFQESQSLCGSLTDFNMWEMVLNASAAVMGFKDSGSLSGDVISWQTSKWQISENVSVEYSDKLEKRPKNVLLAKKQTLEDSHYSCRVLKGHLAAPNSKEETITLFEETIAYFNSCNSNIGVLYLWIGYSDKEEEGVWKSYDTEQELQFDSAWDDYEPNGGPAENCIAMSYYENGAWKDIPCSGNMNEFCFACSFLSSVFIFTQGLCENSGLDTHYILAGTRNGMPYFTGYYRSHLYWHQKTWIMESLWNPEISGYISSTESILPIGSYEWHFHNSVCLDSSETRTVKLSICDENSFMCNDGLCISFEHRCDGRVHCNDQSDEENCNTMKTPVGYRPDVPPAIIDKPDLEIPGSPNVHKLGSADYTIYQEVANSVFHHNTSVKPKPTIVTIKITIQSVTNVFLQNENFVVDFFLTLAWSDPRLLFFNLKNDTSLNKLDDNVTSCLWIPTILFMNARGNEHSLSDRETKIFVQRMGDPLESNPTDSVEVETFEGRDSYIFAKREYSVEFKCKLNMACYPFDTQECSMNFGLLHSSNNKVVLESGGLEFIGSKILIEFEIEQTSLSILPQDENLSTVEVKLEFRRQSGFYLVSIYLPTSIMIAISYLTFYFKVEDFQDRIMVSLTSILVLSSLQSQTSISLPKTPYLKLLDIWLLFCIVIIFLMIIIHNYGVYVNKLISKKRKLREHALMDKENHVHVANLQHPSYNAMLFGKIVIPIVFSLFNVFYWVFILRNVINK